jgi:hypothetical protein
MKIAQKNSIIAKMGGVALALALPLATVESASAITQVSNLSEPLDNSFLVASNQYSSLLSF